MNNTRWHLRLKDIETLSPTVSAEPIPDVMSEFITDAVDELRRRIMLAEERMIFEASPDDALKRIRDVCDEILASRIEDKAGK